MSDSALIQEIVDLRKQLAVAEAELAKHEHCVTPCGVIEIQQENHSANLLLKDEIARAKSMCLRSHFCGVFEELKP